MKRFNITSADGPLDSKDITFDKIPNFAQYFEKALPLRQLKAMPTELIKRQFQCLESIAVRKPILNQFPHLDIYIDVNPFLETMIWLDGRINTERGYINCSRIKSAFQEDEGYIIAT